MFFNIHLLIRVKSNLSCSSNFTLLFLEINLPNDHPSNKKGKNINIKYIVFPFMSSAF